MSDDDSQLCFYNSHFAQSQAALIIRLKLILILRRHRLALLMGAIVRSIIFVPWLLSGILKKQSKQDLKNHCIDWLPADPITLGEACSGDLANRHRSQQSCRFQLRVRSYRRHGDKSVSPCCR